MTGPAAPGVVTSCGTTLPSRALPGLTVQGARTGLVRAEPETSYRQFLIKRDIDPIIVPKEPCADFAWNSCAQPRNVLQWRQRTPR